MKRTLNIAIFMIFALSLFNAAPIHMNNMTLDKFDTKVAVISFKTEIIDYGTVEQNSDGTRIFTFKNTGDAPLLITKVNTSCGCTVPSFSKAPILPGSTGELEIKYDTKRLGAFTKTVTVISNSEGGNKILKIKGNIVASN